MGERDLSAPPPAPVRRSWAAVAVLGFGLLAQLVLALAGEPRPAGEGAASLVARLLLAALAPLAGERAAAVLGVVALAAASALAGRVLAARLGSAAWWLVVLLVFGSGAWAATAVAGPELVGLALAAAAFTLVRGAGGGAEALDQIYEPAAAGGAGVVRWAAVGALLAELVPGAPLRSLLLLPAALAVPAERRPAGLVALGGGWLAVIGAELLVQGPEIVLGPLVEAARGLELDPALAGWNLLYLLAGRHVGLLTGFAPLLLLAALGSGRRALWAICLAVTVAATILAPFDFAQGWLALGFLPLYGALWSTPERLPRPGEWWLTVFLCALVSWPLWWPPGSAAATAGAGNALPRRLLPYETTVRELPSRGAAGLGRRDLALRAVRGSRLLDGGRIEIEGSGPAELYLAAPAGLAMVGVEFGPSAATSIEVRGAVAGRTVFRPDGRIGFELLLERPRARHPLWLGDGEFAVHLITLEMPGVTGGAPLRFRVLAPQPPTSGGRSN